MQNLSKITLLLPLFCISTFGKAQKSFFMSDEDSEKAIAMAKQIDLKTESKSDELKLSGIFFIDESNWTVWINGTPYSSIGEQGGFSIDEVSEDEVSITTKEGETIRLSVKC